MTRGRLLSTVVSAQQQLVDYILKHQLENRYFRIDAALKEEQQADLGLEVASNPRMLRFISHVAKPPVFSWPQRSAD
jgi:hypothetical protein